MQYLNIFIYLDIENLPSCLQFGTLYSTFLNPTNKSYLCSFISFKFYVEQRGIEPRSEACKATVIPLYYCPIK